MLSQYFLCYHKLSQYSNNLAVIHFQALIHLYGYLKATKTQGIYYQQESLRHDLPPGDIPMTRQDGNYDENTVTTRQTIQQYLLLAYVGSNHASNASHCQSVTGFHVKVLVNVIVLKIDKV